MLDIEDDIQAAESLFISIAELANAVRESSGNTSDYSSVANWLLIKLKALHNSNSLPQLVTMNEFFELVSVFEWKELHINTIARILKPMKLNNCPPFTHPPANDSGSYWVDNSLLELGFDRREIADVMPDELSAVIMRSATPKEDHPDPLEVESRQSEQAAEDYRGKETLMCIIAGLAITIGMISGKHSRATGVNKSALARDIFNAISDFGGGMDVDTERIREIITEAIKLKAAKITSNEQEINLAAEQEEYKRFA